MLIIEQVLLGVLMPAVVAGVLLALAWKPWTDGTKGVFGGFWGGAVAIGVAYLAAHLGLVGLPDLVPTEALDWMPYMALLAVLVGVIEGRTYSSKWLRWLLRAAASFATLYFVLGFMVENYWEGTSAFIWLGTLTLLTLEIISVFDRLADRYPGALVPVAMMLTAAVGALVVGLTGSARVAQLLGALAAAGGAALVVAWWHGALRVSRGAATVFTVIFAGLLAFGYMSTADVPGWSELLDHRHSLAVLLVALAPMLLWGVDTKAVSSMDSWKRVLVGALLVTLPLGGAVYLAANPDEEPEEAEEEGPDNVDYDDLYG